MSRIRAIAGVFVLGVTLLTAGCTDTPMQSPVDTEPDFGLFSSGGRPGPDLVGSQASVLERPSPLAADEVVTRTIGRRGGIIRLPNAGLTVIVPRYALRAATEITVTAPAGDLYGYHFEPHGLEFRRSVTVLQDLPISNLLDPGSLTAVYFNGDLEPEVTVLETLSLWLLRSLGVFRIDHFSGYVIATM